ncbi:MAG: glycosyltransferase family 39 protein [Clostridium sp.]
MDKFKIGFSTFMTTILKWLLYILIIVASISILLVVREFNISIIVYGIIYLGLGYGSYKIINSNIPHKNRIMIFLIIALVLRVLWLFNVNSQPSSDFSLLYDSAQEIAEGDFYSMHGTAYIARFPHLTITTLYMSGLVKLFASPVIAMKIFNLIFGMTCVILIYLISKEVFNKRYSEYGAIIGAVFPPFILYTSVFCSENIAMPFYLLSVFLFVKALKTKRTMMFLVGAGVALSVGNLFRMVGIVTLIAFVIYVLIYTNEKLIVKIKRTMLIIVPYFIVLVIVSNTLLYLGVTQYNLWRGAEPSITSVLKGTHFQTGGHWNEEDADLIDSLDNDYEKIEEACKEKIIERLTTSSIPKLAFFYTRKFVMQWNQGDFDGSFWAQKNVPDEEVILRAQDTGVIIFQILYVIVLLLVMTGIKNRKYLDNNEICYLFYLILAGYGAAYLITESQARYSFIVSWVFVFLAIIGIKSLIENSKAKVNHDKEVV